jgi:hypothetical protein
MDPGIEVDMPTLEALDATLVLQAGLVGAAALSGAAVDTVIAQSETVIQTLGRHPEASDQLKEAAQNLQLRAQGLQVLLEGPGQGGVAQQETVLPLSTLTSRLYTSTEAWTGPPTADQRRLTGQAHGDLTRLLADLRSVLLEDLPRLHRALAEEGIPWPAGDIPFLPENLLPPVTS